MTLFWHNPGFSPTGYEHFNIDEEYSYRSSMYNITGVPGIIWNGLDLGAGGASNCNWEATFPGLEAQFQSYNGEESPYDIRIEGDIDGTQFNYNAIVTLDEDFESSSGTVLELFVSEDSVDSYWTSCADEQLAYHHTRHLARAYLTMNEEDKLPISIGLEGESQVFSGSFELLDFWNNSTLSMTAIVQNLVTYEVKQSVAFNINHIPTDRDSDGVVNLEDNCPDEYNPDQEDLDSDLIGDVCDPCNNLVYIPGNVNGDANEGNEPVIDVIDILALSDYLDNGIGIECQILDVLEDGMVNDWDILVLAEMIMNGGN